MKTVSDSSQISLVDKLVNILGGRKRHYYIFNDAEL